MTLDRDGAGPFSLALQHIAAKAKCPHVAEVLGAGREASSVPYTIQGLEPTMILPQVHLR